MKKNNYKNKFMVFVLAASIIFSTGAPVLAETSTDNINSEQTTTESGVAQSDINETQDTSAQNADDSIKDSAAQTAADGAGDSANADGDSENADGQADATSGFSAETAVASFKAVDEKAGDAISLAEAKSFIVTVPLATDSELSDEDVQNIIWSLNKDESKEYVDAEKFPNNAAFKGGILVSGESESKWKDQKGNDLFTNVVTEVKTAAD